ncbi:uncharacterized protein EI90DRAFT_2904831, partial [Cantharellus anzutake]|uniref:uncharacterized protein n=1 Tax=Cantharellus anzutake TaxID=1750568 RepID=UPI0019069743
MRPNEWLLLVLSSLAGIYCQPAPVPFSDCTSSAARSALSSTPQSHINISEVYSQVIYVGGQKNLKTVLIGATGNTIVPSAKNDQGNLILTTFFTRTSVLTFTLNQSNSWFCNTVRPVSPLPAPSNDSTYCPISPGQLAFSVTSPLLHDYNLSSIVTRVRVVDPSANALELACVDVDVTAVRDQNKTSNLGYPQILFWLSVGLVILYWIVIGLARISAAWSRGAAKPDWSGVRWAGTVLASAISGERLSTHSALLRFATPSWRDVFFHTQWCASLIMIAVQWPTFAYPILVNTAWSVLEYNITLSADRNAGTNHWNPWKANYTPPSGFADQMSNVSSPLYLDQSIPNQLYLLPGDASNGIKSFAAAVGLRPQDLFPTCAKLFFSIVGVTIVISSLIWAIDWFVSLLTRTPRTGHGRGSLSPRFSGGASSELNKEPDFTALRMDDDTISQPLPRSGPHMSRHWWHYRLGQSSFHGSVLQGNLVRVLILFHFPLTIFTTYEFSHVMKSSASSIALASLCFAIICVLIPALLLVRLALTPTKKLYDATRTLLALGPLYSHYAQGSEMFAAIALAHSLALGITIGAGQKSGTTQAIVILVIEVASALATSIWLPWGERASMGVLSFIFCVARIVTVVLLIILCPLVSVGDAAGGWIAYSIIVIQALVYLAFLLMLLVKAIEGLVRLIGRVPFDKSTHSMDSGLLGALSLAGCCGIKRRSRQKRKNPRSSGSAVPHGTPQSSLGLSSPNRLMHQNSPPSFLRPEQAFLPYREDADDETGYIMGAWGNHTFGGPSYQPVSPENSETTPATTTSGFARVGGGRAHADSPFSITS